MSIASQIERIAAAKAALKTAINAKGGTLTDELLGDYAVAVAALPSGGGAGILDAAMVTEYTPARAAFTAPASFAVSGFGTIWETDYSAWNGTYTVIAATQYKQGMERVYKKSGEEKYLVGFFDEMEIGGNAWGFAASPSVSYLGQCVAAMGGDAPATGSWMNYDMWESVSLTLTATDTTYPAQAQILNAKKVTDVTTAHDLRTFGLDVAATAFLTFDREPEVGCVYLADENANLGNRIARSIYTPTNGMRYAIVQGAPADGCAFTPSAAVTTTSDGAGNTVIDLSGAQYLTTDLPVDFFKGDFTFAARIKLLESARVGLIAGPEDYMIGIDTIDGYWSIWASSNGYSWDILQSDGGGDDSGRGSVAAQTNTWQTVVYTRDGNTWKLYVDGAVSVTKTRTGTVRGSGNLRLNIWGTGGMSGALLVGAVRIYNRGLGALDVAELLADPEFGGAGGA